MLGRRLLGEAAAAAWGDFAGYAEVAELVSRVRHRCGLRPQQVARRARIARARFAPAGDTGRGRNA